MAQRASACGRLARVDRRGLARRTQTNGRGNHMRAVVLPALLLASAALAQRPNRSLEIRDCSVLGVDAKLRCGTFYVWENRESRTSRRIGLDFIVVRARNEPVQPDPIVYIVGGPGQTTTDPVSRIWNSWMSWNRDLVLLEQRGTGGDNRLDCELPGGLGPQSYLSETFDPTHAAAFRGCRERLSRRFDLSQYSTANAMDDLHDFRAAMGYERINLVGVSYGTRAVLTYLRRYESHVRTAILISPAPVAIKNPLYHARTAQEALDKLWTDCVADAACQKSFPNARAEFRAVVDRLRSTSVRVRLPSFNSANPPEVELTYTAFAEAVRVMLYGTFSARRLPHLVHLAQGGNFEPFAVAAIQNNRGLRSDLRYGMLMSVVCSEDIDRITEAEILRETRGTFLGDGRVRGQMLACEGWPRSKLPADHTTPIRARVPVLLISGSHDPVTSPRWAEALTKDLSASTHIVIPGGHAPGSPCSVDIQQRFVNAGRLQSGDLSCVRALRPLPFAMTRQ